jgi:hypothetical protein
MLETKLKTTSYRAFLGAHYPIIEVLLGALLIVASTGTYTNWDFQLEYQENWPGCSGDAFPEELI